MKTAKKWPRAFCGNAVFSLGLILVACRMAVAAPPAATPSPTPAAVDAGAKIQELNDGAAVSLPTEATFRFQAGKDDTITFLATTKGDSGGPLLECTFTSTAANQARINAKSLGQVIPATLPSNGTTPLGDAIARSKASAGLVQYGWRFPVIKNLWDDADRKEIGAAYAQLVPFAEKIFTMRFVLTPTARQIWLDDRLVLEQRANSPEQVQFGVKLSGNAKLVSADFAPLPPITQRFLPLPLDNYSHAKKAQAAKSGSKLETLDTVPLLVSKNIDIDLGESLFRYRLTHASGPDAPTVNAQCNWMGSFVIDPASLTFRVPHRNYRNVWLLAWADDEPHAVKKGVLRFFRQNAGYPASTDFEISDEAIKKGLVKKLDQKTADGHQLYLIKVPVDTGGLYAFNDVSDRFMEFELLKDTEAVRSYPDPLYYGEHQGGYPSAIHVSAITMETAPFDYRVKPLQYSHVFQRPDKQGYSVFVTNTSDKPLEAKVTLRTKSYDGKEEKTVAGEAKIEAGQVGEVKLAFDLQTNGWHELQTTVEADGEKRENTLSLVVLPPNTRTYGYAANEIRFGLWGMWQHYTPLPDDEHLAMFRMLGFRSIDLSPHFGNMINATLMKKYDFLPSGIHTVNGALQKYKETDPKAMQELADVEVERIGWLAKDFDNTVFLYGAEWSVSKWVDHAPWPLYTGEGDRELTEEEKAKVDRYTKYHIPTGRALREKYPKTQLVLQWGAGNITLAYLRQGFPKDLVDAYGLDMPNFELVPEVSNMTGSINNLWQFRQEVKRLGWPQLPMHWVEGPFLPTNIGALSERQQADHQIRYLLLAFAYGVDRFESAIVPYDAGNFYGQGHYGVGLFHSVPLVNPKPAVAAVATMTQMLCGADPTGGIDTGCLTTYCMGFKRSKDDAKIFALWRVRGEVEATIKVRGEKAVVTDAMGNTTELPVKDGAVKVTLSSSPVWLTGVQQIDGFEFGKPVYDSAPANITRPLAKMTAEQWTYDGAENKAFAENHFATKRITDPNLKAEFGRGENGHADAVAITLAQEPGDRPLANRYGTLKLNKPATIPGKASALGLWVKGNSSWGRVVYQLRDAKGELWTSNGTVNDWNCDDTHAWSYVSFEDWRYVRFPLPGSKPYDSARELETTWWGSTGGDRIVDLPLTVEKIFVEARNEVPYLGEMKLVTNRSYLLSDLIAEYDSEENTTETPIAENKIRKPLPEWDGLVDNPIAKLTASGVGPVPEIKAFEEPAHYNDGRRMHLRFDKNKDLKYNLYLSRYPDGRGAELLMANVDDNVIVRGFRPEIPVYLFLTSVGADKKESQPSKPYSLTTHDNFREK